MDMLHFGYPEGRFPVNYCGYHSHSTFSDGKNTAEEMVQAAIRLGMPSFGISDHSFTPCDTSYCMREEDYPLYVAELRRLQEKYKDRISLMVGIELDANSDKTITQELDYFLGSVHYLLFEDRVYAIDHAHGKDGADNQRACIDREFGGDKLAFVRHYFDTLASHIENTKPTIVGHFDVITKFSYFDESDPAYQAIAKAALERIVATTPVVEVNTGAIARHWRSRPYPADFLLQHLHRIGGEVILGADTHAVETIDCFFPQSIDIIKAAGFDHILTLWPEGFHKESI